MILAYVVTGDNNGLTRGVEVCVLEASSCLPCPLRGEMGSIQESFGTFDIALNLSLLVKMVTREACQIMVSDVALSTIRP